MKIPTVIFRLKTDADGIVKPGVEYLARDSMALFHQAEWSWIDDIDGAYLFADTYPAEAHLSILRADGEEHAHTRVYGRDEALKKAAGGLASAPRAALRPEEAYEMTRRHLGERD